MIINEGFVPKRKTNDKLPPGQYEEKGFPVLTFGPRPEVDRSTWSLEITGKVETPLKWNWEEFSTLPHETIKQDIHCVTKWSKFGTTWSGVSLDTIMEMVGVSEFALHVIAHSYDGYTTNIPVEDIKEGRAWIATSYEDYPLEPVHGGPARLLVPHLYFWKSAKWLSKIEFVEQDSPGFWETRGYHNYGDPWREERYTND